MTDDHKKLRYSVRAWVAILSVICGPGTLIALFVRPIPAENGQQLATVIGFVLGWGSAVVTSQFGRTGSTPPRDGE